MSKPSKQTTARKPVKARGALPTPRMAPARVTRAWYKRRGYQLLGAALLIVLIFGGVSSVLNIRENSRNRARDVRAVRQFERKVQLLQTPATQIFTSMNEAPPKFLTGAMSPEEYRAEAERWVEELRKLNNGLKSTPLGSRLQTLEEARGLYVQGTMIYVDAAKSFALASRFSEIPDRTEAILHGRNLLAHGAAVLAMGERQMQKLRNRLGLNEGSGTAPQQIPVQLPEEDAGSPQQEGVPPAPGPEGAAPEGVVPGPAPEGQPLPGPPPGG